MFIDTRNKNKVSIVKDYKSFCVVKSIKDNKRYLIDKRYLKEIK